MNQALAHENAFKTALALTLAYTAALALNWDEPIWAVFGAWSTLQGVTYAGMTLHLGVMRLMAAFAGGVLATAVVGLTAQSYWISLTLISMSTGFWFFLARRSTDASVFSQCGHVGYVVWMSALFEPQNTFTVASYRVSETCLGIVIGTLVAYLVRPNLELPAIRRQMELLRHTLSQLCNQMASAIQRDADVAKKLTATEAQLDKLLDDIESLFVSAQRNALLRTALGLPYDVFVRARILMEHLGALLSLLRQQPQLAESALAGSVSGWLLACAAELDRMDWQRNTVEAPAANRASSIDRFREQLDRSVLGAAQHMPCEAGRATLVVAVRDQLDVISSAIRQLSRRLTETAGQIADLSEPSVKIVATAAPLETVGTNLKHGLVSALALFAAGAFWFTIYIPSGGSVVMWAGIFQMILVSVWVVPYRKLMVSIGTGTAVAFLVVFLVLPRLDGALELSVIVFVGSYLLIFVCYPDPLPVALFLAMLMVKEEQGNFNTLLQPWLNVAVAIVVGLHIGLGVTMLLMPANSRRRLCAMMRQVLSCASRTLHDTRDEQEQRPAADRMQRERRLLLTACKRLAYWSRQVAGLEKSPDADAINKLAHELQVTTGTLLALESCRVACAGQLTIQEREGESQWRSAVIDIIGALHDGVQEGHESKVDVELLIRHVDEAASRGLQSAGKENILGAVSALSLTGHYRVVCAALRSLAAAFRQCDFPKLLENRF